MKVCLLIESLSVRGGTHKQLLRLAQYLRSSGDRVDIVTREYEPSQCYEEFGGFEIRTAARRVSGRLGRIASGLRLEAMIPEDSDVLNVHDQGCELIVLESLRRRRALPVVWQINDLHPAYRAGPHTGAKAHWLHPLQRFIGRLVAKRCQALTVNVTKNAGRVAKQMGVEARVFYCGVDQAISHPMRRRLGVPLHIISVGVLFRYRNYEAIIEALSLLGQRGIGADLTIVGSTKYHPEYACELESLAEQLEVDVRFLGELPASVLLERMAESHVFVFVNLDQSWGLAAFEALNMSLPVVLSESVGAVELLRDNPSVRVVDPKSPAAIADALAEMTSDQRHYERLASTAFESVRAYTWDRLYGSNMRNLFLQVANRKKHPTMSAAAGD
jgi:glycosyltransferase involved in cell wall biosynthesis